MDTTNTSPNPFPAARFIKEIGRGVKGARSMSREDAKLLYAAMLDGRVSDLELGGILLAMRIKGESVEEIAGFMDAAESSFAPLPAPPGDFAPVLIPSYNGARKLANLTPLLALLLAREGVPVLVHGVQEDPGRVTTAEIFAEMGIGPSGSTADMLDAFAAGRPCFMPIELLAPELAHQLALRRILGVRNSTHTIVKILQPFEGPALRLVSYTHPEYLAMLTEYFATAAPHARGDAFLMRGTEGETVANANRAQEINWFHAGQKTLLVERDAPTDELAPAPEGRDAAATADWIARALRGEQPVPPPIAAQVAQCVQVSRALRSAV
ncbi:glycosyl transferase [Massilia sp. Root133]|jgi:anthranilate phosphoribosyltransferase|uniref:DNA-binding protein YbiB n=1 Tax=Massilia cellulosiltytica TaxID=2683234 RepID=A0A7X3G0H8_9BURK|nr:MULTISPECIES: DNA-binding protein YbiB [Telluria group]KQY05657.1 glycosyl transferase [Massilia sp. Root133]KQZ52115.1 glycosyl transferase [Massilia sp. Root1485]MVW61180.1 DNA-binding protein YbiB [Telluria cellulosilytica]